MPKLPKITISQQYLKKEVIYEVDFFAYFLEIDTTILMGMVKHS